MRPLRIAFLTPEFPTELAAEGGLSNYLNRLSRALVEAGHVVEVFTLSEHLETAFDFDGVRVQRVNRAADPAWLSAYARLVRGPASIAGTRLHVRGARALAQALAQREAAAPFDIVQSSNYALAGLFVPRLPHRTHLVRCSSSNALWRSADRRYPNFDGWCSDRLEGRYLTQPDRVYSPSRFVADDYGTRFGVPVQVVRPPIFLDTKPGEPPPIAIPARYLMHFGQISRLKGSDVLAEALNRAWAVAPDLRMVWAGADHRRQFAGYRRRWGNSSDRVTWCGPLAKPQLYALVRQAIATVAPSRFDNLPNTVLESMQLGIPVIGSKGASIDEIIEQGVQGELVPVGDAEALARALVRAWRRTPPFDGRNFPMPRIFHEMRPAEAVNRFLELAGHRAAAPLRKVA